MGGGEVETVLHWTQTQDPLDKQQHALRGWNPVARGAVAAVTLSTVVFEPSPLDEMLCVKGLHCRAFWLKEPCGLTMCDPMGH